MDGSTQHGLEGLHQDEQRACRSGRCPTARASVRDLHGRCCFADSPEYEFARWRTELPLIFATLLQLTSRAERRVVIAPSREKVVLRDAAVVGSGNAPVRFLGSDDRALTSVDDVMSDVHAAIAS